MSFGEVLFGRGGEYQYNKDPRLDGFQNDYANEQYKFGPARKYYGNMLRMDQQGRAGELDGGMFGQMLGNRKQSIDNSYDPLSMMAAGEAGGTMGKRYQDLQKAEAARDIYGMKSQYIQGKLANAGNSLQQMFADRNNWNANKYGTLIGSQAGRSQLDGGRGGLINSVLEGAGAVGAAYATGGASAAMPKG